MDKARCAYLRRQKVNVEDLGEMGQILLEKADHWLVPIFKNGEAVAMVIEMERFDRDWVFSGKPSTQEDSAFDEELLRLLIEQRG
ncbi:hypothetical protein [Ruegeria meonggei]|uniref:Uncharacterized protein n=1 Tax=Ruegeria meonggei TaxID=1446476 RepID=A0A1X6ZMM2_9RHOB|nr:hypothetical protein [Ruegeria meonggei]SLN55642.1 hypothetical protein RUM8411_02704 [Ruegeria meonggei]